MNEAAPAPPEEVPAMPRTTDAPGGDGLGEWDDDERVIVGGHALGDEAAIAAEIAAHERRWIKDVRELWALRKEVVAARAELAALRPVVAAVAASLGPCWGALCRCVDEFEPGETFACDERRQDLYGAVGRVLAALAAPEEEDRDAARD